jgi:hypothetical protein
MNGSSSRSSAWLSWAQQPREQGGLGLAPHQAAGVVGNLVKESGDDLPAWGPTGDNRTAWGTAQWREDRLRALQQMYPDSYQTMESQQSFMRHELDTTHNKAYKALQAARTPEEAATAFNRLYEVSADNTGGREKAARQLMAQFGGGGTPASPGALTSSFAPTESKSSMPAPALSADETLGPGALGSVSQDKMSVIGQALAGMGSSLAGISNPDQAKVLAAQSASMQKQAVDHGTWSNTVLPDGRLLVANNKNPNLTRIVGQPGQYAKPEKDDYAKEADKLAAKADAERFADVNAASATADQNLAKIQKMRKATLDRNVTFGGGGDLTASAKNWLYSMGGNPDGLTSTQLIEQAAKENQLGHAKALGSNPTNYEDKIISASQGLGLDRTRELNLANQDALEAVYRHQKALAEEARKYKKANGKLDDGWLEHQAQWEQEHPLDTTPRTRFEAGGSAAPATAAPKTNTFKTPNGKSVTWSY